MGTPRRRRLMAAGRSAGRSCAAGRDAPASRSCAPTARSWSPSWDAGSSLAAMDAPRYRGCRPVYRRTPRAARAHGGRIGRQSAALRARRYRRLPVSTPRRPGRGLRRLRRGAEPRGGPQGDPGPARRRPDSRPRFLLEAEVTGGPGAPGHRAGLRPGRIRRRPAVLRHAVHPGREPQGRHRRASTPADRARPRPRPSGPWRSASCSGRFVDVCNAIAYAHSRGVLHRDLKPAQHHARPVRRDPGRRLGPGQGARPADPAPTSTPRGRCRPRRSRAASTADDGRLGDRHAGLHEPRAGRGTVDRLGPASDIYSLGATLYCLLTGQPPFDGRATSTSSSSAVREGDFPPPRQVNPGVPAALEAICLKAMALRAGRPLPLGRGPWPTTSSAGWPTSRSSAYREPWPARVRRWVGRHRTFVSATAAAVVIAMLSLVGSVALLAGANQRERESRADAVAARDRAEQSQKRAVTERVRAERAQERAIAEAERAREEARKATMLSDFLVRLFQSTDPLGLEGQGFREPTEGVKELDGHPAPERGAERITSPTPARRERRRGHRRSHGHDRQFAARPR